MDALGADPEDCGSVGEADFILADFLVSLLVPSENQNNRSKLQDDRMDSGK